QKILNVSFSASPVLNSAGKITSISIITRDLTEQRRIESEMSRIDRLNLVGQMAAGLGHEIRNPMTTVRGFLQLLANKEEDGRKSEYYDIIIEELDRANGIITEFLSLAKSRLVNLKSASLNKILNSLHPLMTSDAMKQDKRLILKKGDIPNIPLSEKEIPQLIINLVRNAFDASPSGGVVTVGTYAEKGQVVLYVEDEGCGIQSDVLDKLGTPFVTTKDEGTGLGLSVCYSIADKHNAKIDVKTGLEGTTFYVRFNQTQKRAN
ncbi:MAG TPA: ATP-binding protein, partial [Desulfobacteria bacterium]|nr:ATP-binding protein [Desulfobacteria bacterium]